MYPSTAICLNGSCGVNSNFADFLKKESVTMWLINIISCHKDANLKMYLLISHLKSDGCSSSLLPLIILLSYWREMRIALYFRGKKKNHSNILSSWTSNLGNSDKWNNFTLHSSCVYCSLKNPPSTKPIQFFKYLFALLGRCWNVNKSHVVVLFSILCIAEEFLMVRWV